MFSLAVLQEFTSVYFGLLWFRETMMMNITSKFINHKKIINRSMKNLSLLFVTTIKQALTTNAFVNTSINRSSSQSFSTTTATTTTNRITRTNSLALLSNHYEIVGCKKYFAHSFSSTSISSGRSSGRNSGRNRNAEKDNNESDWSIWYKLFLEDKEIELGKVKVAANDKDIYTIKKYVIQEHGTTLKKFDAADLQVFSGIEGDNQLENNVDWDHTIHGGGKQNPLTVEAYEQRK
jgi:hypothetical protein